MRPSRPGDGIAKRLFYRRREFERGARDARAAVSRPFSGMGDLRPITVHYAIWLSALKAAFRAADAVALRPALTAAHPMADRWQAGAEKRLFPAEQRNGPYEETPSVQSWAALASFAAF